MHQTSLRHETLERFLERLASTDPAPGGGGSAAVATAMADARRREIREALVGATAVPLEIARLAADVAGLGNRLVAGGNPNLEGDAGAAVLLARAAARAAARLVELNVAQGKLDGDWCDRAAASVARAERNRPPTG